MVSAFAEPMESVESEEKMSAKGAIEPHAVTSDLPNQPSIDANISEATNALVEDDVVGDNKEEGEDNEEEEEDGDIYVVEKIVNHKKNKKEKSILYKVRWEGYGSDDDTWEPHESIAETATDALDTYWETLGGYEANRFDSTKRKRQSASADILASNALPTKRRKQVDSTVSTPAKAESRSVQAAQKEPASDHWSPPLELKSWETMATVLTLEKDETNQLYVFVKWHENENKSRHAIEIIYKKMPQAMLSFYEANLVFKPAK